MKFCHSITKNKIHLKTLTYNTSHTKNKHIAPYIVIYNSYCFEIEYNNYQ